MGTITIARRAIECELAFGDNSDRRCNWCGAELTGRKERWCSSDCSRGFARNHYWTDARAAAVVRDGGCVLCGANGKTYERLYLNALRSQPRPPRVDWLDFLRSIDPGYIDERGRAVYAMPRGSAFGKANMLRTCDDIEHQRLASRWYDIVERAGWWWKAVVAAIAAEVQARSLEVNHKTPILGRHGEQGCHHHQDELEVLCHRHHVVETNRQRAAGELTRRLPSRSR